MMARIALGSMRAGPNRASRRSSYRMPAAAKRDSAPPRSRLREVERGGASLPGRGAILVTTGSSDPTSV